jgi:hypothetical protein
MAIEAGQLEHAVEERVGLLITGTTETALPTTNGPAPGEGDRAVRVKGGLADHLGSVGHTRTAAVPLSTSGRCHRTANRKRC